MHAVPKTMKATAVENPGEKAKLVVAEIPTPVPGPHDILIEVAAAGLNRADLLQAMGLYPPPPGAPNTMGLEVSGRVAALGSEVSGWKLGDNIVALLAGGGYAQYCAVDAGSCLPMPLAYSFAEGAAIMEAYCTVWTNVVDRARLKPGETLLVHGGTSGIGTTAIMLFASRGHRVFATAGSGDKCGLCTRLGAARAIDYKTEDFVDVVKAETGGKGVDVILDMVGGDYIERNLKALAVEGRLVNIAYQSGSRVSVDFLTVMLKRLTITGSTLRVRSHAQKAEIVQALRMAVWPALEAGVMRPVIDSVFPFAKAGEAHARLASGSHAGKIILEM